MNYKNLENENIKLKKEIEFLNIKINMLEIILFNYLRSSIKHNEKNDSGR